MAFSEIVSQVYKGVQMHNVVDDRLLQIQVGSIVIMSQQVLRDMHKGHFIRCTIKSLIKVMHSPKCSTIFRNIFII